MLLELSALEPCIDTSDDLAVSVELDGIDDGDLHHAFAANSSLRVDAEGQRPLLQEHPVAEHRDLLLNPDRGPLHWPVVRERNGAPLLEDREEGVAGLDRAEDFAVQVPCAVNVLSEEGGHAASFDDLRDLTAQCLLGLGELSTTHEDCPLARHVLRGF